MFFFISVVSHSQSARKLLEPLILDDKTIVLITRSNRSVWLSVSLHLRKIYLPLRACGRERYFYFGPLIDTVPSAVTHFKYLFLNILALCRLANVAPANH